MYGHPEMSRVVISVILFFIFNYKLSVSGLNFTKLDCFTLNSKGKWYNFAGQPRDLKIELVCLTGFIYLQSFVFSIPKARENYCPIDRCYDDGSGGKFCDCCRKPNDESKLCWTSYAPLPAEDTACNGERRCSVEVWAQDLRQICGESTDYGCNWRNTHTGETFNGCRSRWVEVQYQCRPHAGVTSLRTSDVTTYTTTVLNIEKNAEDGDSGVKDEHRPDQIPLIGLSVGIFLVTLLSAVIIVICHVRNKRLYQRYNQQLELNLGQRGVTTNASGEPAEGSQVQLLVDGSRSAVKYGNNNNARDKITTGQSTEGIPKEEGGLAEMTYQNVSPDTADAQQAVYAQVQDDLKKKNRTVGIDGSNHWTNPEQGQKKGEGGNVGVPRQTDAGSAPDMVENVYYEGSAWT